MLFNKRQFIEASRSAGVQACECKRDRLWVRFSLEITKYLIFSFLNSNVEAKCGVDFRHSSRNATYRIQREAETIQNISNFEVSS